MDFHPALWLQSPRMCVWFYQVVLPVLPAELSDIVTAPTPFVVGFDSALHLFEPGRSV